jgi:hypothetical protein
VGEGGGGFSGVPGVPAESEGVFRMFVAGRMVLGLFLESHGTLVAVSAPPVMPLRDWDIPMNVPCAFRNFNIGARLLCTSDGVCVIDYV